MKTESGVIERMRRSATSLVGALVFAGTMAAAARANAQCCPKHSLAHSCDGVAMTRARWCIDDSLPNDSKSLPTAFCAYGEKLVTVTQDGMGLPLTSAFEFDVEPDRDGGVFAGPGKICGATSEGEQLSTGVFQFAPTGLPAGYLGYTWSANAILQSTVLTRDWPSDWLKASDDVTTVRLLNQVGMTSGDTKVSDIAALRKAQIYPGGSEAFPDDVVMDQVFDAMPRGDALAALGQMFSMVKADSISALGEIANSGPGYDERAMEYVVAYLSLVAKRPLLKAFQGSGDNSGAGFCNNTPDSSGQAPFTCSEVNIDAIATAHCSNAANGEPEADVRHLRLGSYSEVGSGPCGSTCPSECSCDTANHCVAYWLGTPQSVGGSGQGDAGMGGAATGSAGIGGAGGSAGVGGASGFSGVAGGASLAGSSAGGVTSSGGNASGGGASIHSAGRGALAPAASKGGCSFTGNASSSGRGAAPGLLIISALAGLSLLRGRSRPSRFASHRS